MHAALPQICNLWDGGEFYVPLPRINSHNLLKKCFHHYPDAAKVVLNIKGALHPGMIPDDFVRQSVELASVLRYAANQNLSLILSVFTVFPLAEIC